MYSDDLNPLELCFWTCGVRPKFWSLNSSLHLLITNSCNIKNCAFNHLQWHCRLEPACYRKWHTHLYEKSPDQSKKYCFSPNLSWKITGSTKKICFSPSLSWKITGSVKKNSFFAELIVKNYRITQENVRFSPNLVCKCTCVYLY